MGSQQGKRARRVAGIGLLAALGLAVSAPSAGAAVTIGQLAPPGVPATCVNGPFDLVQRVTAGDQYVVPPGIAQPRIVSWSTQAAPTPEGQTLSFKVLRKVADPGTYLQVAHDGPRVLTSGPVNTFPVNIPVQAGDVIAVNDENALTVPNACLFTTSAADIHLERGGSLTDGEQGAFSGDNPGERVNVAAVVKPSNTFTLGAPTKNKKKGTALLPVTGPGPGTLVLSGTGLQAQTAAAKRSVNSAGTVSLVVKAVGKKRKKLNSKGKAGVAPTVTYTPTGGDPSTHSTQFKLKKRLKK
jgi:hypothetical protein